MNSRKLSLVLIMSLFSSLSFADGINQSFFDYVNGLIKSGSYYEVSMSDAEKKQFMAQVEQTFKLASGMVKGAESDYKGWEPADLKGEYYDLVLELYSNGKCRREELEDFLKSYDKELVDKPIVIPPKVTDKRPIYLAKIKDYFSKFLTKVSRNVPACAKPNQVATAPKCCEGLIKMHPADPSFFNNIAGKKSGESCNKQSECKSQVCLKETLDAPGVCASIQQCYELQTIGGDCSGDRPYCEKGECLRIDKENVGGVCNRIGSSCTQATADDCCSNKCVNNKCVESKVCMDCVRSGAKPKDGQTCCPGYYLDDDGKCKTMLRPLVPTVYNKTKKFNILNKVLDLIIPSAFAEDVPCSDLTFGGTPPNPCNGLPEGTLVPSGGSSGGSSPQPVATPAPADDSSGELTTGGDGSNPGWSSPAPVYNPATQRYETNGTVWVGQNPPTEADYQWLDLNRRADSHKIDPLSIVGKSDPNYSSFYNEASAGNFDKPEPLIVERQQPFPGGRNGNPTADRINARVAAEAARNARNRGSSTASSDDPGEPTQAQIENCQENFTPGTPAFANCIRGGASSSQDTGIVGDGGNSGALDAVQQNEINQMKEECNTNFAGNEAGLESCLNNVALKEAEYAEANLANSSEIDVKDARFAKNIRAPQLNDKTYSDPKQCVFHTFNDIWKDATPRERNAELFLRSFEYVFSNRASQDYWQDKDKGNIYRRARSVAVELRKNRAQLIERTLEVDKEMTCKCIAIFGPLEFPEEKQAFFNENCAEEAAELRASLSTGNQGQDGGSNVDGNTVQSSNDEQATEAQVEEIDKGALALSHERLLIEFLRLRAEAQVERFTEATDLIEQLDQLAEFISEVDFQEVWKDRVQGDTLITGTPPGDSRLLYKWGFKYPALFLLLLIALFVFAAVLAFTAIAVLGAVGISLGATAIAALFIGSFGGAASPGVFDLQKVDGATYKKVLGVVIYKWDGYEKWYVGPKFDNKSTVNDTHCKIFARASACFKNAYAYKPEKNKVLYLGQVPDVGHYLLDTKLPYFVDQSHIVLDKMPQYFKTWPQIMNETVEEGVRYLKSTRPSSSFLKRDYYKAGKKFGKIDQFKKALDQKYFMPYRGNFKPTIFNKRSVIVTAAKKFAMCKSLRDQASSPGCFLNDSQMEENALGFGHLFENPIEALAWANYTYELHYVYPSITRDQYMGYPLMGAEHYFATLAYMIKLVAAYSAQRAINYADTVDLYRQDWEKRAGDYSSLGEAVSFTESRNIKFGESFFDNFGLLNFSGKSNLEEFDTAFDKAKRSGKFSKAELDAFKSGRQFATKLNGDIDKQSAFDKKVGKTKEGKRRRNFKNKLASALENPISVIRRTNPGLNSSSVFAGNDAASIASNNNENTSSETDKTAASAASSKSSSATDALLAAQRAALNSAGSLNFGSGSSALGEGVSANGSGRNDSVAGKNADDLIDALAKDENLTKRADGDTLWIIVSKAYKRNYSRVLYRKADLEEKEPEEKEISDKQKSELKSLLD